jgi:hypothetical protein
LLFASLFITPRNFVSSFMDYFEIHFVLLSDISLVLLDARYLPHRSENVEEDIAKEDGKAASYFPNSYCDRGNRERIHSGVLQNCTS